MIEKHSAHLNPNPILQVLAKGDLYYINPSAIKFLEILGFTKDQFEEILPPNFQEVAQNCLMAKTSIPATQMLLGGRYLLWSSFFFEENSIIEFYGMDVTRMVRVEQSLRESKEKAEEGEKIKAAFLDNMSHEIRTPLNSLLGFMELLNDELLDTLSEDQRFYFDLITQNGNRLERTMREILDISQFSSSTYKIKKRAVDVLALFKGIVDERVTEIKNKNLDLRLSFPDDDYFVNTDEYCLIQSLTHLLDNAVKYTEEGFLKLGIEKIEGKVVFRIEDSGPGMDDDAQRRIFIAFSQGTMGHTKQFQGIGLGLSLVRVYLDTIGAEIELESELGSGSRFKISL